MNEIIVRTVNLPYFVHGQVLMDENGDYNIYINARLPYGAQRRALDHEMMHVKRMDLDGEKPILIVERDV